MGDVRGIGFGFLRIFSGFDVEEICRKRSREVLLFFWYLMGVEFPDDHDDEMDGDEEVGRGEPRDEGDPELFGEMR